MHDQLLFSGKQPCLLWLWPRCLPTHIAKPSCVDALSDACALQAEPWSHQASLHASLNQSQTLFQPLRSSAVRHRAAWHMR